jgi:putative ABC transport system permease protein
MPGHPFSYTFLDEYIVNAYEADRQFASVVTLFSIVAILLACCGLFGLLLSTVDKRLKEITIRKIVGASARHLFYLMIRRLVGMIAIATCASAAIALHIIPDWLNNFPNRIDFDARYVVVAGFFAMLLSVLTVSFHTWRAATSNPVDVLRTQE